MSLSAPTPPLLLTKRLTSFLHSNLSPQIHTALLSTLSGKLLAHASTNPVSTLRTQSTVAASIWGIYSSGEAVSDALPQGSQESRSEAKSAAVTIQLSAGVLVVRKLKCGLLFVCIGPSQSGAGAQAEPHSSQLAGSSQHQQSLAVPSSQQLQTAGTAESHSSPPLGSPSEVASVVSAAPTTNSLATAGSVRSSAVVQMRRHAEELARWLDDKLGTLGIPDDGSGEAR
ncbi:hypothetical protein PFICI_10274 [Pestalotiopsis fici W106-1]|uniref:Uncharacterized protein n=1 Tax=Pestalotiopsis fici (strain W106-1 / CGMCC3.15140) TaxID=1229662 RepID=W3WYL6_PESFW|nr:uncharacterized protein PFICI_10274 [Pestalotiopsis fici W106-1]ETS78212.1 hypothetical protein PFICI_10274 [Pestalotiopsis fici W106-1]